MSNTTFNSKFGFRYDYASTVNAYDHELEKLLKFELLELGNDHLIGDILAAVASDPVKSQSVFKAVSNQVFSARERVKYQLDLLMLEIRAYLKDETGPLYGIWLCTTQEEAAMYLPEGSRPDADVTLVIMPEQYTILSDLGHQGKLLCFREKPTYFKLDNYPSCLDKLAN